MICSVSTSLPVYICILFGEKKSFKISHDISQTVHRISLYINPDEYLLNSRIMTPPLKSSSQSSLPCWRKTTAPCHSACPNLVPPVWFWNPKRPRPRIKKWTLTRSWGIWLKWEKWRRLWNTIRWDIQGHWWTMCWGQKSILKKDKGR